MLFMADNLENYGDNFQQKSKYVRDKLPRHILNWAKKPKTYKVYSDTIKKIKLPEPKFNPSIEFWNVIKNRHSSRKFTPEPLSFMELSLLLYGMSGINRIFPQFAFRTVPSAGGLYPTETYPVINNVTGLEKGLYHYDIQNHSLNVLKEGDFRRKVAEGCLDQNIAFTSAINFLWTAMIGRSQWKYLQRCYRYIYLDAGHIGQNFYLIAEALGLGACTIGAIYDDELNQFLEIDGKTETVIYIGVTGKKK
ncbi:MAG: SagB/ThcOx family dehydrogenase [Candidatus Lokiarchaeota archaeon]|nr:SagB/ThcOx family dehydrogenase [Candidatus Lokiarchaeota archaeon]